MSRQLSKKILDCSKPIVRSYRHESVPPPLKQTAFLGDIFGVSYLEVCPNGLVLPVARVGTDIPLVLDIHRATQR